MPRSVADMSPLPAPSRFRLHGRNFRAVLFDMDGTLLDTERLYAEAMFAVGEEHGTPLEPALLHSLIGRGWSESRRILEDALGGSFDSDRFSNLVDARVMARIEREGVPRKSGVEHVLGTLSNLGVPMAVVTSTRNPKASAKLVSAGLRHYFDRVITGDRVQRGKPDPEIYRLGLAEIGERPEDVLAIEDSPNGLRSAVSAGIATILVPDIAPVDGPTAALAWRVERALDALGIEAA